MNILVRNVSCITKMIYHVGLGFECGIIHDLTRVWNFLYSHTIPEVSENPIHMNIKYSRRHICLKNQQQKIIILQVNFNTRTTFILDRKPKIKYLTIMS